MGICGSTQNKWSKKRPADAEDIKIACSHLVKAEAEHGKFGQFEIKQVQTKGPNPALGEVQQCRFIIDTNPGLHIEM